MVMKCPICNKERSIHSLTIVNGKVTCLCCHTGMSEELESEFVKCGDAIFEAADKIWEKIYAVN